jgi:hypothetical protein
VSILRIVSIISMPLIGRILDLGMADAEAAKEEGSEATEDGSAATKDGSEATKDGSAATKDGSEATKRDIHGAHDRVVLEHQPSKLHQRFISFGLLTMSSAYFTPAIVPPSPGAAHFIPVVTVVLLGLGAVLVLAAL